MTGQPMFPQVTVRLADVDGNTYATIAAVQRAMIRAGAFGEAKVFATEAMTCTSYADTLRLCRNAVVVT